MKLTQPEVARRIANRASQYERLLKLGAPHIILDNQVRMIREMAALLPTGAEPAARPTAARCHLRVLSRCPGFRPRR